MTWDPAEALRGDIPTLHPLERAAYLGGLAEAKEEAARQRQQAERRMQAEVRAAERQARQRMELLTHGYTSEELAAYNAERSERREARIAELEAELERLDPARARAAAQRHQDAVSAAALARARMPDEFMQGQVARYDQRRAHAGDLKRQQRADDLARLAEAGWVRPEICR